MVRHRARIRFQKQGDLRFAGHRDLIRALERLFRRAGLKLGMSEGFHPKPRMSFPSALAVGIEGLDEVMELELAEPCTAEELSARLRSQTVPGLSFTSIEILEPGTRKAQLHRASYAIPVPAERCAAAADEAARLLAESSRPISRPHGRPPVDLRASLEDLSLRDGVLAIRLRASRQASAGPRDVLAALDLGDLEPGGYCLTRTRVELEP